MRKKLTDSAINELLIALSNKQKVYLKPEITVFQTSYETTLLAGSPPIKNTPDVVDPVEDNEDTELELT